MQPRPIIHILVSIVDNYGDIGMTCEIVEGLGDGYEYIIWTDAVTQVQGFVQKILGDHAYRIHIYPSETLSHRLPEISGVILTILRSPIPDLTNCPNTTLILHIDHITLDPLWITHDGAEHMRSTPDHEIREMIPSPIGGAGLIPHIHKKNTLIRKHHIVIFAYPDTLSLIDWESFPPDIGVYVAGGGYLVPDRANIISLPLIPLGEFYDLIDTSEWVIIRGETSFSHVIQGSVPFLWDMYRGIGGIYHEQSEQFLDLIDADRDYREFHNSLNHITEKKKINYYECTKILSQTRFVGVGDKNLITTLKKYIDRFYNSI